MTRSDERRGHLPRATWIVSAGSLVLLMGCGGGQAQAQSSAGGDVEVFEFDRPLAESEMTEVPSDVQHRRAMDSLVQQEALQAGTGEQHALLGARHDLRLAPEVTTARCECLGVVLGSADAPGLAWQGDKPSVHPTDQVVLALGSAGIPCSKNPDGQVASYRGYSVEGGDVIVTVENAHEGRPVTQGAILPRPSLNGQIYVKPRDQRVPFGRGLDGSARCNLGHPGASREAPNSLGGESRP